MKRRHLRTDPACAEFREARTRLGRWRFESNRGRSCPVCFPPLSREEIAELTAAWKAARQQQPTTWLRFER